MQRTHNRSPKVSTEGTSSGTRSRALGHNIHPSEPQSFMLFEAEMLASRYDRLKDRDKENYAKHIKLFSFLAVYGAAPFLIESPFPSHALRAWGVGGAWLVVIVLFTFDRDFRAYGLHLKERVYCLFQLAVLRGMAVGELPEYRLRSLLPLWSLRRERASDVTSFPERLSTSQIRTASYFFKFLGLFPLCLLTVFCLTLLAPGEFLKSDLAGLFRVIMVTAIFPTVWLWRSFNRCFHVQKTVFEARRIESTNPWPTFPTARIKQIFRVTPGWRLYYVNVVAMVSLSVAAIAVSGYFLWFEASLAGWISPAEWRICGTLLASWVWYFFGHDQLLTRVLRVMGQEYEAAMNDEVHK